MTAPQSPKTVRGRRDSLAELLNSPPLVQLPPLECRAGTGDGAATNDSAVNSPSKPTNARRRSSLVELDWTKATISEVVAQENVVLIDESMTVEEAFNTLVSHQFTSLPIRSQQQHGDLARPPVQTSFDYASLLAYLLVVLGYLEPTNPTNDPEVTRLTAAARANKGVPVSYIKHLGAHEDFTVMPAASTTLLQAAELLGSGIHRIAVNGVNNRLEGILSQRRLVRYLWENSRNFQKNRLDQFFQTSLAQLGFQKADVVSVRGDEKVLDALLKMQREAVSSLAVLDSNGFLQGNFSVVDVAHLTNSSQFSLLKSTCKQFVSYILHNRGLENGRDSVPVFHVGLDSTMGRTIAKFVATKAHRLWIVQPHDVAAPSPVSPTKSPLLGPLASPDPHGGTAHKVIGVVSLTDVLSLLAKHVTRDFSDIVQEQKSRRSSSHSRRSMSISSRRSLSLDRPVVL